MGGDSGRRQWEVGERGVCVVGERRVGIGGWCSLPSPLSAEVIARAGFDWICVDMQHGLMGVDTALSMLQAIDTVGVPAFVRVRWNERDLIMQALDAGADGVIVPMVRSVAEARRAAEACRYPPEGERSWGPVRAALRQPGYCAESANRSTLCAVMIETALAMNDLEEIVNTPGVDAIYIGPVDLALSRAVSPAVAWTDGGQREIFETITRLCEEAGRLAGLPCRTVADAEAALQMGFNLIAVPPDIALLTSTARGWLDDLRSIM